jgi:hypothetical protein
MGGVGGICQGVAAITVAARPRITQRPSLLNFPVREREKFGRVWKRDAIEKELMQSWRRRRGTKQFENT